MTIDLANTELNISSASVSYVSMQGDTAQLVILSDTAQVPAGFEFLERVIINRDEKTYFAGYVNNSTVTANGTKWQITITLLSSLALYYTIPYMARRESFPQNGTQASFYHYFEPVAKLLEGEGFGKGETNLSADQSIFVSHTLKSQICPSQDGLTTIGQYITDLLRWSPSYRAVMSYDSSVTIDNINIDNSEYPIEIDITANTATGEFFDDTFLDVGELSLSARHDLIPPAVILFGSNESADLIIPDDGIRYSTYNAPFALPEFRLSSEGEQVPYSGVQSLRQKEIVRGTKIPKPYKIDQPNSTASVGNSTQWQFWQTFQQTSKLATAFKTPQQGLIVWGECFVNCVPADEAYPPDEITGESTVPANYSTPDPDGGDINWDDIYLHQSGQFLASVNLGDCTPALRFCKVVVEQNIYVERTAANLPTGWTAEEFDKLLPSRLTPKGQTPDSWRYSTMRVEGYLINRGNKHYYPLTNELSSDDADYTPDPNPPQQGSGLPEATRQALAQQYYDSTRKLNYDGTITLYGWRGNPNWLLRRVNIKGGATEWESMNAYVTQADLDLNTMDITLTLGSLSPLTVDELLDRKHASVLQQRGVTANASLSPLSQGGSGSESEKDNGVQQISASYSASLAITVDAPKIGDFAEVAEGNDHYTEEGVILAGGEAVTVPRMKIENYQEGKNYAVRAKYNGNGSYTFVHVVIPKKSAQ